MTSTLPPPNPQLSLGARVRSWFGGGDPVITTGGGDQTQISIHLDDDQTRADGLRERWQQASLVGGWMSGSDWWDPACDAVVEALVAGVDPQPALHRLGRARAELGCPVEETIDDLVALWQAFALREPPVRALRALASGWAEAGLEPVGAVSCLDPMTRMATRSYLEARLAELYRDARPGHPADLYTLVIIDVDEAGPLGGVARMCRVAEVLRRVFTSGETLARVAPGRAVALCQAGPDLASRLHHLEGLLRDRDADELGAAIWMESLPRSFGLVHGLLTDLTR